SDVADAAVSYAKDAYDNSGDTFRGGQKAVAKSVQDNPLGALLVAGGIGFALALLMTRPPRRSPPRWRYYGYSGIRSGRDGRPFSSLTSAAAQAANAASRGLLYCAW